MKKYDPEIEFVASGSIAEECGIRPGDRLISVNGEILRDIIDYQYTVFDGDLTLLIENKEGIRRQIEVCKDDDEDLGIGFCSAVFDGIRKCGNHCIFCFVDQMIKGLRKTLYVKDDDYRLSFLYGNYITLTNITESDLQRILEQRLSPLFISVHAVDPDMRAKLLGKKDTRPFLPLLSELSSRGIDLHGQVVLVPGMNDGKYLKQTIEEIGNISGFRSLALVPVGLTKCKNKDLVPYRKEQAQKIIELTHEYQRRFLAEKGTRFVFASDEFYLLAEKEIPEEISYEEYPQIENGVGLIRSFWEDFYFTVEELEPFPVLTKVSIITGVDGEKALLPLIRHLNETKHLDVDLITVKNLFFGETVTVTGLLTGKDIIDALKKNGAQKRIYFLPDVLLKHHTNLLLDDISVAEIEKQSGCVIRVVETNGAALADAFTQIREELL